MRSGEMFVAVLAAGVMMMAGSAWAQPGPNGHNNYGLCKAYFSGSPTGQGKKHSAPPFAELERQACQQSCGNDDCGGDCESGVAEAVMSFCDSATPGGK